MAAKKGIDFRLFTLKSLFIKGFGCVIAQNDGIDEDNPCRKRANADCHCRPLNPRWLPNGYQFYSEIHIYQLNWLCDSSK